MFIKCKFCRLSEYTPKVLTSDTKIYKREYDENHHIMKLVDSGQHGIKDLNSMIRDKDSLVDDDGNFMLQCELKAMPFPATVHLNHDSKALTGMVGLENLGATCYLNALLQVNMTTSNVIFSIVQGSRFVVCMDVLVFSLVMLALADAISRERLP